MNSVCFLLSLNVLLFCHRLYQYTTRQPIQFVVPQDTMNSTQRYVTGLKVWVSDQRDANSVRSAIRKKKKGKLARMRLRCFLLRPTERKLGFWQILNSVHWLLDVARSIVNLNPEVSKPVKFVHRISSDNMTVQYVGPVEIISVCIAILTVLNVRLQ